MNSSRTIRAILAYYADANTSFHYCSLAVIISNANSAQKKPQLALEPSVHLHISSSWAKYQHEHGITEGVHFLLVIDFTNH
jgi:hypothetical protein